MSKKLALLSILIASLLVGCSVVPQFKQAREDYLETRVVEILSEMPTAEPQVMEEATATTEVVATEEPTAEPIEEITEEPTEATTEEAATEA